MTTLYKNTGSLQYIPETNIILSKKKKNKQTIRTYWEATKSKQKA